MHFCKLKRCRPW